jgi:hypothetical protein
MERARAAGAVCPDAAPQDLPLPILMLGTLVDASRGHAPDVWRRYLALILDGLRAEGHGREPLPPAISVDNMDRVIAACHETG